MARGAKVPRQGAVHSVAWDEMLMAPKKKPYRASQLESLPAEIRQRIYLFIGIANGGKGWDKCPKWPGSCSDASHYKKSTRSELLSHYQTTFSPIYFTKYKFKKYNVSMPEIDGYYYYFPEVTGNTLRDRFDHFDDETFKGHLGLLCTNKFLCADVYSLIYNNTPAELSFELSNRAIHLNNWPKHYPNTEDEYPTNYYNKRAWERMQLSPFPFRFMTHITLTPEIGAGYESQMPHRFLAHKKRVGSYLIKQASSIRYIARHCPALRDLEICPKITPIEKCKLGIFDVMAFAMQELVCGCPDLKRIALTYLETRRVSLADYPEIADIEQQFSSKYFHDLLFGEGDWFSSFKAQDCLEFQSIPQEVRDDKVREWVKSALVKIRKHNLQAPLLFQELWDGRVINNWDEKYSTMESWKVTRGRLSGPYPKAVYYTS